MSTFVRRKSWVMNRGIATRQKFVAGTLTLDGEGADAADIPASKFGLAEIEGSSVLVKADNVGFNVAAPNTTRNALFVLSGAVPIKTDVTGAFEITVWGR